MDSYIKQHIKRIEMIGESDIDINPKTISLIIGYIKIVKRYKRLGVWGGPLMARFTAKKALIGIQMDIAGHKIDELINN